MKQWAKQKGFTIVELLVVVVVIAILAAVTVVAYNGMSNRSKEAAIKNAASQAYKKIESEKTLSGSYPASLSAAGVPVMAGHTYDYRTYPYGACVNITNGQYIYHVSADNSSPTYGTCGQVKAEYFNNTTLSGTPALTRYEDRIDNSWGTAAPGLGVNPDNFSARYTSYLVPPITDTYTFYSYVDDGERVWVNGTLLGDYYAAGPCCSTRTLPTTITLNAGEPVAVTVEMREGGGGAAIRLLWSYTGQAQVIIPTDRYIRVM